MKRFVLSGLFWVLLCGVVSVGSGPVGGIAMVGSAWGSEINPLATGEGVRAVERFKLQRMGISPDIAERALGGGPRDPVCSQDAGELIGDYDRIYPGQSGPPYSAYDVAAAESDAERLAAEMMGTDHCSQAGLNRYWRELDKERARDRKEEKHREWLEKHPPSIDSPETPEGHARLFFLKDRQGTINKLIKFGLDPILAENASRLVTAQKGRFEQCALWMDDLLLQSTENGSAIVAENVNHRTSDTKENVCDIGLMYQDPNAKDPYQSSIDRLIKAFHDDRKGTIRRLVKAGVDRIWAKEAAKLLPPKQGRYERCGILMGALLDDLDYGGDVAHHVEAINEDDYGIGGGNGVGLRICDSDNRKVGVSDGSDNGG